METGSAENLTREEMSIASPCLMNVISNCDEIDPDLQC